MCPRSDWAGVRPGHTSVQLFVSGAGSREGSHSLNSLLEQPGVIVPAPWSQRQGCASRLQRALCLLTPALGAGRQWWPLGHPQTRGSGCAHSGKLCCPPEEQTGCVVVSTVSLPCPTACTAASSPWSPAGSSAQCQGHGYHAESLLGNAQRPQWSCWEASQESRAAGSSQDSGSAALLAQSLHHGNPLWSSLFPVLGWL